MLIACEDVAIFSKVHAVEDYPHAQFDRKLSTMHTANKLHAAFLQTVSIGLILIPCANDCGGQGTIISVCMGAVKKKNGQSCSDRTVQVTELSPVLSLHEDKPASNGAGKLPGKRDADLKLVKEEE